MLKKIRKRHGETLTEMASKLFIGENTLRYYENKKHINNNIINLLLEKYVLTESELKALKKMRDDNDNIICVDLRKLSPKRREQLLSIINMRGGYYE